MKRSRKSHCPGCTCDQFVNVTAKAVSTYRDEEFWDRSDILKGVFGLKGDRIRKDHHGRIPKVRLPELIRQMSDWPEWRLYVESNRSK